MENILTHLALLVLPLVYGYLVLLITILRILWHGRKYFQVKKRDKPLGSLEDPQLGRHAFISLKEVKLHYVANGDSSKPLLLLLHGFPDFWYSWRHQLKEFANDYWVVAVDLRGYNESSKPTSVDSYTIPKLVNDIKELIPALGKQRAILGGHDWGGVLAWYLAWKHPELVERLLIINAPHPTNFAEVLLKSWKQFFSSWYMFFFQLPYLPELVIRACDLDIFNIAMKGGNGKAPLFNDVEAYKYVFSQPGALTPPLNYYRANLKNFHSEPKTISRISVPTLMLWGDRDKALTVALATGCKKYVDNITVHIVQGASHWVHLDKPFIVNQHIRQFLQQ